jgi:hypothetical protein
MSMKNATGFSPFQLVYGMEVVLPIEFQIPSLNLVVALLPDSSLLEEHLLYLKKIDEQCRDTTLVNGSHKKQVKC